MRYTQTKPNQPHPASDSQSGFSLIITVTMMILLSLIAVGLLSLSSVTLRAAGSSNGQMIARANARMALQIAIGELQKSAGPDTRITANASILDNQQSVAPGNSNLVGIWNAWQQDTQSIGSYQNRKEGEPDNGEDDGGAPIPEGGFYRWLVSSSNQDEVEQIDYVTTTPEDSISLVAEINGVPDSEVRAATVAVSANNETIGRYGWAVLDDSQKASLNAGEPRLSAGGIEGTLEAMTLSTEAAWSNSTELVAVDQVQGEDRDKLISTGTLELAGIDDSERFFHDLTANTQGILSDVVKGGLKTDLSLLFQDEELPNSFTSNNQHIYSNDTDPIMPPLPRPGHPHQFPSPDPTWSLLHQYYRIPVDNLVGGPANPSIRFQMDSTVPEDQNSFPNRLNNLEINPEYHNSIKLAPVISKAQFIFSMSFGGANTLFQRGNSDPDNPRPDRGIWVHDEFPGNNNEPGPSPWVAAAQMIVDPIITLWNPYDVPLDVSRFYVYLYRIPLAFQFETSNPAWRQRNPGPRDFGLFSNNATAFDSSSGDRSLLGIPLELSPPEGENSFTINPGEHLIFSATNSSTTIFRLLNRGQGSPRERIGENDVMELRPGWSPPGGDNLRSGFALSFLAPAPGGGQGAEFDGPNPRNGNMGTHRTPNVLMQRGDTLSITVSPSTIDTGTYQTVGERPVDFLLRYGSWVRKDSFAPASEHTELPDFGAIEFNYGEDIQDVFATLEGDNIDIPTFPVNDAQLDHRGGTAHRRKRPFLVASLNLKSLMTEANTSNTTSFPGKSWIHSNPNSLYASTGIDDQNTSLGAEQYEFTYRAVNGAWTDSVPEHDPLSTPNRGFGGPSPGVEGRAFAPFTSIPRELPTSLAQFRHAPLNQSGQHPLQAQVVGNSFAHPLLEADEVVDQSTSRVDHSFLANMSLFDSHFLSSARDNNEMDSFLRGGEPLRNTRFTADLSNRSLDDTDVWDVADTNSFSKSASLLTINGPFNVNSTSELAWTTFLGGFSGDQILELESLDDTNLRTVENDRTTQRFSRFLLPLEESLGTNLEDGGNSEGDAWKGGRTLTSDQIQNLAREIVEQVKLRGPFQSLGEFINRRAEESELGRVGALQAAIDASGINDTVFESNGLELDGNLSDTEAYQNSSAAEGSSLEGTPGFLMQGDLLNSVAPFLTVRSDTFRIRTYGSATDNNGRVLAEAWSEAVVQRGLDFVDPSNEPDDYRDENSGNFELTETNQRFGRSFRIVSFRWLTPEEVNPT